MISCNKRSIEKTASLYYPCIKHLDHRNKASQMALQGVETRVSERAVVIKSAIVNKGQRPPGNYIKGKHTSQTAVEICGGGVTEALF